MALHAPPPSAPSLAAPSLHAALAADAIDFVVAFLLPLILPTLSDPDRARALALRLLAAHNPANERDLQLAGEAVGFSIRTMAAFAQAADPNAAAGTQDQALRRAGSLSRSGLQVQRCLIALQRDQRGQRGQPPGHRTAPPFTITPLRQAPSGPLLADPPSAALAPLGEGASAPLPANPLAARDALPLRDDRVASRLAGPSAEAALSVPGAQGEAPVWAPRDLAQAEARLRSAETLLAAMQA